MCAIQRNPQSLQMLSHLSGMCACAATRPGTRQDSGAVGPVPGPSPDPVLPLLDPLHVGPQESCPTHRGVPLASAPSGDNGEQEVLSHDASPCREL